MKFKFFDANLYVGRHAKTVYKPAAEAEELIKEMDRQSIEKAIVWHIAQHNFSPAEGNAMLSAMIRKHPRLCGCWTILPPQTGEVITRCFFRDMKENRIAALRAFPDIHRFLLNRTVFGGFLDEVSDRKIPLLLSMEKGCSWEGVYNLLEQYPALLCILCDIGVWGTNRYTWPLLENYKNVYLETSLLAIGHEQVEAAAKKFGAGRIVFGSGFPERYPESSICEVLHCNLLDSDKKKISWTNLDSIISGVRL
ncbi:MAG: hypothetical protein JW957_08175 [Candidatus Omnitrophica bacterium]|nr:hypothetical protein [Candidatus Omnitrophota bacterium]